MTTTLEKVQDAIEQATLTNNADPCACARAAIQALKEVDDHEIRTAAIKAQPGVGNLWRHTLQAILDEAKESV